MSRQARDGLRGMRVGLLEARMAGELVELVRRYGASIQSAPAVRETAIDGSKAVGEFLETLNSRGRHFVVFLTGTGVSTLFGEAERQGKLTCLRQQLEPATIICRGPKPVAALRRYGIGPTLTAEAPYTTKEIIQLLEPLDLSASHVTIVHYGERSSIIGETARYRGAVPHDVCVYEWRLPDDLKGLEDMVRDIAARRLDVVIFTSQVQWKHLLQVARALDAAEDLIDALTSDVLVASIGPVCSAALLESGVQPHIEPVHPKMGPLIAAVEEYFRTGS